jgi:gamma-glutamylcyclotransferase (GGCT)/AIG2-like uncharacterized protein YtfP
MPGNQKRDSDSQYSLFEKYSLIMPEHKLFFVYGTLRQGDDNDITRLAPPPRLVGTARIAGTMYHLGGYPGVTLGGAGEVVGEVVGEVYEVSPPLEAKLDAIEAEYPAQSDEYFKREIEVQVAGQSRRCCVYEINPRYVQGKRVIASGDWCKDR